MGVVAGCPEPEGESSGPGADDEEPWRPVPASNDGTWKRRAVEGGTEWLGEVRTDNEANETLAFFFFRPSPVEPEGEQPVLLAVPPLNGSGPGFARKLLRMAPELKELAIVAPSFRFDRRNWDSETSYQFPSAWSGGALMRILRTLERTADVSFGAIGLIGFSAGAQVAVRFPLWRPERTRAAAVYAPGGVPAPEQSVDVSFLLGAGKADRDRVEKIDWFARRARQQGIPVRKEIHEGGHVLNERFVRDAADFLRDHLR